VNVDAATVTPLAPAFERALAARPDEVRQARVWIGGRVVEVRVAGVELFESLTRALVPATGDDAPDLAIDLWDAEATGVAVPDGPPLYGERQDLAGGALVRSPDRRWLAHHHPDFDVCVDRVGGRLVGGVRHRRESIGWHPARPLQQVFIPWLAGLELAVVHAAMVVSDGAGALVAGPSGHGKSTTAAASISAGLGVLGDDTVSVEATGEGWIGHCLHATVKTRTDSALADPALVAAAVPLAGRWRGESVLFLNDARPEAVVASARVAAILLPRLSDLPTSEIEPVSAGRALSALTGEALSLEPGQVAAGFERVSALAEGVPAFRLHVGRDPATIPAAIRRLLEGLSGS
jgi:hypothetical protein